MDKKKYPKISVVTPTLNAQRVLELCLKAINDQKYPGKVEVIIADGGSSDDTIKIAKKYKTRIVKNKLKTGEAGKAVGVRFSTGEIIALIDSDNIAPNSNWLKQMVQPFLDDPQIIASEPLYFTYRKKDFWLTRYFALLGMGDPLSLFIGNYDRYCYISDKWTQLPIDYKDEGQYLILNLKDDMPTIGANGFFIRKEVLKKYPIKDYLFDIDVLKFLTKENPIKVAKVKTGVVHLFSGDVATFIRKQRRRIRDYLFFQKSGMRVAENPVRIYFGVLKFILAILLIFPILIQTLLGFFRKPDPAWLFHPVACFLTLFAYGFESIQSLYKTAQFDRSKWSQ